MVDFDISDSGIEAGKGNGHKPVAVLPPGAPKPLTGCEAATGDPFGGSDAWLPMVFPLRNKMATKGVVTLRLLSLFPKWSAMVLRLLSLHRRWYY